MIGVSLAYLQPGDLTQAADTFFRLQDEVGIPACELHMEAAQFSAGFWYWDRSAAGVATAIRDRVEVLGVHLPYLDLNPVSANPRLAKFAMAAYKAAIARAAAMGADYVVFHARGKSSPDATLKADLACWRTVVARLTEFADSNKVTFCFENADDVRPPNEVAAVVAAHPHTKLCLDTGHLFERIDSPYLGERIAGRFADRFLPWAMAPANGLPYFDAGGCVGLLSRFQDRLHCVHVHNHNGRMAHQPLAAGKAPLVSLLRALSPVASITFILEADYRQRTIDIARQDLLTLKEAANESQIAPLPLLPSP